MGRSIANYPGPSSHASANWKKRTLALAPRQAAALDLQEIHLKMTKPRSKFLLIGNSKQAAVCTAAKWEGSSLDLEELQEAVLLLRPSGRQADAASLEGPQEKR